SRKSDNTGREFLLPGKGGSGSVHDPAIRTAESPPRGRPDDRRRQRVGPEHRHVRKRPHDHPRNRRLCCPRPRRHRPKRDLSLGLLPACIVLAPPAVVYAAAPAALSFTLTRRETPGSCMVTP